MATNSSATGQRTANRRATGIRLQGYSGRPGSRLRERRRWALEPDARELVHAHHLDQPADLGLRPTDQQRTAAHAQAASEHGQVQHQRSVGEHELAEVDYDIGLGTDRADESLATATLSCPVLISAAAQD